MTLICDLQTCLFVAGTMPARKKKPKQQYLLLRPLYDQLNPEAKRRIDVMIKMKSMKLLSYSRKFLMQPAEPLRSCLSFMDYFALDHAQNYGTKLLCSRHWFQTVSNHLSLHDMHAYYTFEESMMVFEPPVFGIPTVSPAMAPVILIVLYPSKKQHEKQSKNKK
jgi:hypothetical protein